MLRNRALMSMAYAVVDVETTGISEPAIVEIAVTVYRPSAEKKLTLAFDTLVNPGFPIPPQATEVHGVGDDDVSDAPTIDQLVPVLHGLLAQRVVVAHNASFDIPVIEAVLARGGVVPWELPHICTMHLPPLIGRGEAGWSLLEACSRFQVPPPRESHSAAHDSYAAARLLQTMVEDDGLLDFGDLPRIAQRLGRIPRFVDSFGRPTLPHPRLPISPRSAPHKSRSVVRHPRCSPTREQAYCSAVLEVVLDLDVDEAELGRVRALQRELDADDVRRIHDDVWRCAWRRYTEDGVLTERELEWDSALRRCLKVLAPSRWG